jgi:hypothetical protein
MALALRRLVRDAVLVAAAAMVGAYMGWELSALLWTWWAR